VQRTLEVYGETIDDLWVFDEQLARWSSASLNARGGPPHPAAETHA
jgi:hypothetical protein